MFCQTWSTPPPPILELEICSFFQTCHNLIGYVIRELGHQNAYSAGKTNGDLRGDAPGAKRCYLLSHYAPPPPPPPLVEMEQKIL